MLKSLLAFVLFSAAIVLAVVCIGALLPVRHVASRECRLRSRPETVWKALDDIDDSPSWRSDIKEAKRHAAAKDAPVSWTETGHRGETIDYEIVESQPPTRLVRRIATKGLPFGGRWVFDLQADGEGTRLTVTEEGEVYSPVFRFVSRFIMGHTRTMDVFLSDLKRGLGEESA